MLLDGYLLRGDVCLARHELQVHVCSCGEVVVVAFADGTHGGPVVFVDAEDQSEDWGED